MPGGGGGHFYERAGGERPLGRGATSAGWTPPAYDKTDSSVERITNTLVQYNDDPRDLNVIGSTLYFTAESTAGGGSLVRELWKTDGTFSGTSLGHPLTHHRYQTAGKSLLHHCTPMMHI